MAKEYTEQEQAPQAEEQRAEEQPKGDLGLDEVQRNADEELKEGYRGVKVDPTPNSHYTVEGVLAEKPTPETDADAQAEALKASRRHFYV